MVMTHTCNHSVQKLDWKRQRDGWTEVIVLPDSLMQSVYDNQNNFPNYDYIFCRKRQTCYSEYFQLRFQSSEYLNKTRVRLTAAGRRARCNTVISKEQKQQQQNNAIEYQISCCAQCRAPKQLHVALFIGLRRFVLTNSDM